MIGLDKAGVLKEESFLNSSESLLPPEEYYESDEEKHPHNYETVEFVDYYNAALVNIDRN